MTEKATVIVLKGVRYADSDLILQTLTEQGGRLDFLARGALKSRKRFGGGILQPSHLIEVQYRASRSSDRQLNTLEDARLIEGFEGLRSDYLFLETAFHFLKLIGKMAREGVEDSPELFDLLVGALRELNSGQAPEHLRPLFEMRLLDAQGVLTPDLQISDLLNSDLHSAAVKMAALPSGTHQRLQQILSRFINS